MHHRILIAAIPALLITGCAAGPSTPPAAQSAAPATSAAPAPSSSAGPTNTKSTKSTASTTPDCKKADLKADLTGQNPFIVGKKVRAMIGLTNSGKTTCKVSGWVTPVLSNAAGDTVPVKVEKVEEPGPAVTIVLKPGRTALAGMKWTQCDKGDSTCAAGNAVTLAEAAETENFEFPAAEKSGIGLSQVQVGPLQPSNQGVVAW